MDELQELFGDGSLTYAEFSQKVTESGKKFVDVSGGGYVAKGKFDKLSSDFAKYKEENDVSKYADYDDVKAELETLKAEKAENALTAEVTAANVDGRFAKFVVSEVKQLVTDEKDFKTALSEYLKTNPQYIQSTEKKPVFEIGTSLNHEAGADGQPSTNQMVNDAIRKAISGGR